MPNFSQRAELRYCDLKEPVHIVGKEWGFEWYPSEVEKVIRYYDSGQKLPVIARRMERSPWDTLMLLNELRQQGRIKVRKGWAWVK